jgi:hypothetical protein
MLRFPTKILRIYVLDTFLYYITNYKIGVGFRDIFHFEKGFHGRKN